MSGGFQHGVVMKKGTSMFLRGGFGLKNATFFMLIWRDFSDDLYIIDCMGC